MEKKKWVKQIPLFIIEIPYSAGVRHSDAPVRG